MTELSSRENIAVQHGLRRIGYLGESRKRSLVKSMTWRVIGTIITVAGIGLATGDWTLAGGLGIIINLSKMGLYFYHERLWEKIDWERIRDV